MDLFSPLMKRTALAKAAGLLVGVVGFYMIRTTIPTADPLLAWGVLALCLTIGGLIGVVGTAGRIPLLDWPLPSAVRGAMMSGWVALLVLFFGHGAMGDAILTSQFSVFGLTSPWWLILDAMVIGALIDGFVTWAVKDVPDLYSRVV